ncbi:MAG: hypothetical protein K2L85_01125, partial [Paramuribaculum sp.]|nr:hypothetical protein [Paramuribaculum sp.]
MEIKTPAKSYTSWVEPLCDDCDRMENVDYRDYHSISQLYERGELDEMTHEYSVCDMNELIAHWPKENGGCPKTITLPPGIYEVSWMGDKPIKFKFKEFISDDICLDMYD